MMWLFEHCPSLGMALGNYWATVDPAMSDDE